MKSKIIDETFDVFPVYIKRLEILTEKATKEWNLLKKIHQGRVYKAYKGEEGYLVFPDQNSPNAFLFFDVEDKTENYEASLVRITDENITDLDILDEDYPLVDELLDKKIGSELEKLHENAISERHVAPSNEETTDIFNRLSKTNPKLSRSMLELARIMVMRLDTANEIDNISNAILLDPDLGKGACMTGAMNSILKHVANKDDMKALVDAASYLIIELSRNLKNA